MRCCNLTTTFFCTETIVETNLIFAMLLHYVSKNVLLRYYTHCLEPFILYGSLIYGCTSKNTLLSILKVQKKSLHLIYFKNKMFSGASFLQLSGLLNVYQFHALERCKFALTSILSEHSFFLNSLSVKYELLETRSVASGSFKVPTITNALVKKFSKHTWCSITKFFDC